MTDAPPPVSTGPEPRPALGHRAGHLLLLAVLVVAPFGLRLWPIAHGAPYGYVPDTHVVRNALQMAQQKDPVPPAGAYSSYPYLLPYVMLPVYASEYVVGRAVGAWGGTTEFGHRLQEEPFLAHLPARVVFALISSLAALAAFGAARAAGLGRAAWFAAWLAGTSLLHVHLSVQERPWAPLATLMLLTAWPAIRHARSGSPRALYLSAVLAALAASVHQAGLAALGMSGIAWAIAPKPQPGAMAEVGARPELVRRVRRGLVAVGLFMLVALPLGYPFYVVHGLDVVTAAADHNKASDKALAFGGQQMHLGFRMETLRTLSRTLFGYEPALVVLCLAGLVKALKRRALWPPTLFALGWAALFMTNLNDHVRYLLPLALLMTLPAALTVEALWRRGPTRALALLLLALPLVQALRIGHVLRQPDTRAEALARLGDLPPGSRTLIDVYGPPAPKSMRALETTAELRELYGREAHRVQYYQANVDPPGPAGLDALGAEDLFTYDLRHGGTALRPAALEHGSTTREMLDALGVTHVLLVDRAPADGRQPLLVDPTPSVPDERDVRELGDAAAPVPKLAPLELEGEPLWSLAPGDDPGDAHLPTEMRFPLTDLWTIRRPGPALELWAL